jgi:hypothetical protein
VLALSACGSEKWLRSESGICPRASEPSSATPIELPTWRNVLVAERAGRQQQAASNYEIRIDDPLKLGIAGVEISPDLRERHVGNRVVQRTHEQRQAGREQGETRAERSACEGAGHVLLLPQHPHMCPD